jgi:Family of unknown function (DUF6152)
MRGLLIGFWGLVSFSVPLTSAHAHHSFAMYDPQQVLTLNGTVKEFQWSNPHAVVWVLITHGADNSQELWSIELPTSPAGLTRMGWDKHSLTTGDKLILEINPLRDGEHGGTFRKATVVATGKVLVVVSPLNASAPAPPAAP